MSDIHQQSIAEGSRLAHMYDAKDKNNPSDKNSIDKLVHDALLQDFIKSHHSEMEMDTVLSTLKSETAKTNNKEVQINGDRSSKVTRDYDLFGGKFSANTLFDVCEGVKAYQADDKQRDDAAKAAKESKDGVQKINFLDGAMGLKDLFGSVTDMSKK